MAKVTLTSKSSAMKSALPLLTIALLFGSCTTAYKLGQTPDDVYFSPERPVKDSYAHQQKKEEKLYRNDEEAYRDDRYLRMKIRDHRYTGLYEDYYSYNPYYYHYYNGSLTYNSPWNSYSYWNFYYNPYCSRTVLVIPKTPTYNRPNRPRTFDMNVYNPPPTNTNSKNVKGYNSTSSYNNLPPGTIIPGVRKATTITITVERMPETS